MVKNCPANVGDARNTSSIPGWGRSPGEGNGKPLQYSCLENPKDRGAWQVTLHGVTKSQTQLSLHPTQPAPVAPAFSCQEQSLPAPISGRPLAAPENQPVAFFVTHPSLFYTHPFTFDILDFPLLWISLFSHVLCFPNSFFGKKVCICTSPSSLWSLIFRNPWQQWFLSFHRILCPPPTSRLPFLLS